MTSFQQYQQKLVSELLGATAGSGSLPALLAALPYYADPAFTTPHRDALCAVLRTTFPDNTIAPQPDEVSMVYFASYVYTGPYPGYAAALCPNSAPTDASRRIAPSFATSWWQSYGLAVMTDAARIAVGLPVDTGRLAGDLSSFHTTLVPALTNSVMIVLQTTYQPTATQFPPPSPAAVQQLLSMVDGMKANINQSIAMGGQSATAATWLLYLLWIVLKALGDPDVDGDIRRLQAAGLTVPAQVGPGTWWSGGFTSWFAPLAGPDLSTSALSAPFPEQKTVTYVEGGPHVSDVAPAGGYSYSLAAWGPLANYKPPPDSCLGPDTRILMADGTSRPISRIRTGDEVLTDTGPGRVTLVESPLAHARPLYRINDLDLYVTAGHPLRAIDGPARRAVDPWHLMDAVPTMTAAGVGRLTEGVRLAGPVTVTSVSEVGGVERVYDLIVDNGGRAHAPYYAGGPRDFVLVDAESADPLHDVPTTLAIVAAMNAALPAVRAGAPLPTLLADLAAHPTPAVDRPGIPGPEYYLRDGSWDSAAAGLETYLIRRYARSLHGLHHAVVLELLGDVPTGLSLTIGDWTVSLADDRWRHSLDAPVLSAASGVLRGPGFLASFYAPTSGEHFVFSADGAVVGRIAINREPVRWGKEVRSRTTALGHHVGTQLAGQADREA
jgi:hypothetical protein